MALRHRFLSETNRYTKVRQDFRQSRLFSQVIDFRLYIRRDLLTSQKVLDRGISFARVPGSAFLFKLRIHSSHLFGVLAQRLDKVLTERDVTGLTSLIPYRRSEHLSAIELSAQFATSLCPDILPWNNVNAPFSTVRARPEPGPR